MKYKNDIERIVESLDTLKNNFPKDFPLLIDDIVSIKGDVITVGIGKSGIIATKLSSTLCSVGVRSFFVHPVEAVHGDLGRVRDGDLCIVLSHSGNSPELKGFLTYCTLNSIPVCAITNNVESYLAKNSKYLLNYRADSEICPNNLAPTISTTVEITICDLIAVQAMRQTGFSENDFRKYHPGGSLGVALESVSTISRPLQELEAISLVGTADKVLTKLNATKFGIVLVMEDDEIKGIITDGDYRRYLQESKEFDMASVLTDNPIAIESKATIKELKEEFTRSNVNIIFTIKDDQLYGFVHVSQVAEL